MTNLNDRICVIGGGPAGISAAMYLQKKGYENYEIYEKLNKVGGKSYSPKISVNGEERSYETGAIMGAITYHAVLLSLLPFLLLELMKFVFHNIL